MTLPTCAVLCQIHEQDGSPSAGARITAKLSGFDVDDGYVAPLTAEAATDEDGVATLHLWPNALGTSETFYSVKITTAAGKRLTTTAVVPNAANANLHDISELPPFENRDIVLVANLSAHTSAASNAHPASAISGLGTMATQSASNVAVTGGTISGVTKVSVSNQGTGIDWDGATTNSPVTSPFRVNSNHTGAAAIVGGANLNEVTINSDTVALDSTQSVNGLAINHNFGGGNSSGSRQGQQIYLVQVGSTKSSQNGINPFFVASVQYAIARYSEGGTAPSYFGGKGHVFALNPVARLQGSATNYYECTGVEVNITAKAGTSVGAKKGIQIVKESDDAVQGGDGIDTALLVSDQAGSSARWNFGVIVGGPASQWPMHESGTIIGAFEGQASRTVPANAGHGVDFGRVKFSGSAFRSMGFAVSGDGAVTARTLAAGPLVVSNNSIGATIDVPNRIATSAVVSAGGSGYAVGDRLVSTTGGIYEVTSVAGGAVATVSMLVPDRVSGSPPPNPIATTPTAASLYFSGGTGCTLAINWTSGTRLTFCTDGATRNGIAVISGASGNACEIRASGVDADQVLRINAAGTYPVDFGNPANGISFRVWSSSANTVNYILASGKPSGGSPTFVSDGADANVGMAFATKGVANFGFSSGANGMQFHITSVANASSYLNVAAASGSGAPSLGVLSTQADADIAITPKGSGVVRFGTWASSGDASITGYITIRDASGTLRKLATIA